MLLLALHLALAPPLVCQESLFGALTETRRKLAPGELDTLKQAGVLTRLGQAPRGFGMGATSISWSPDGARVLTAGTDGAAALWHAKTGDVVLSATLTRGDDAMLDARFLPDGRIVALWSDGALRAHNPKTLAAEGELGQALGASSLEASAGGSALLAMPGFLADDSVAIPILTSPFAAQPPVRIEDGRILTGAISDGATRIVVNGIDADGARVIALFGDGDLDAANNALATFLTSASEDASKIGAVALSSDGRLLALGGWGVVTLFDVDAAKVLSEVETTGFIVTDLRFDAKTSRLHASDAGGHITTIRVKRPKQLATCSIAHDSVIEAAVGPKGRTLAVLAAGGALTFYDTKKRAERNPLDAPRGPIAAIAFSPDGETVYAGGPDGRIARFDVTSGDFETLPRTHSLAVRQLAVDQTGSLASSDEDGIARSGPPDAIDAELPPIGEDESRPVSAIASPAHANGVLLGRADGSLEVRPGGARRTLPEAVTRVALSGDGTRYAAVATDGRLRIGLAADGGLTYESPAIDLDADSAEWTELVTFAGGDRVVTLTNRDRLLVRAIDGGLKATIPLFDEIAFYSGNIALAVDPTGRWAVTDVAGHGLTLCDLAAGRRLVEIDHGAPGAPTCAAFSHDGRRVAFGRADGTVWVWDVERLGAWLRADLDPGARFSPQIEVDAHTTVRAALADRELGRDGSDRASYHLESAATSLWLAEKTGAMGTLRRSLSGLLETTPPLQKERTATRKRVASIWMSLARDYAAEGLDDLSEDARTAAGPFTPALVAVVQRHPPAKPIRAAKPESTERSLKFSAGTNERVWWIDAQGLPLFQPHKDRGLAASRYPAMIESAPSGDLRLRVDVVPKLTKKGSFGLLVGLDEAGRGGLGAFVTLDRAKGTIEIYFEDRDTLRRITRRRYTGAPEEFDGHWQLSLEVKGKDVVFRVGETRVLRGGLSQPIRGRHGLAVRDWHASNGPARFNHLEITPEPGTLAVSTAPEPEPGQTLMERLDVLEQSLGHASQLESALRGIYRVRAMSFLLTDPLARRQIRTRVDDLATRHDPLAAPRARARARSAAALLGHAKSLASADKPCSALAYIELASAFDPSSTEDLSAPLADCVRDAETNLHLLKRSEAPGPRVAATVHALFRTGSDRFDSGWAFTDAGAEVTVDDGDLALMTAGKPHPGGDIDVITEWRATASGTLGVTFEGGSDGFLLVSISRSPLAYLVDVARVDGSSRTSIASTVLAVSPAGFDGWMTLRVRFRTAGNTLEVLSDSGILLSTTLDQPMGRPLRSGDVGVVVAHDGGRGFTATLGRFEVGR